MGVTLDAHQIKALKNLDNGKILCGGVGTGKSRTAVAYWYIHECGGYVPVNGVGERKPMKAAKPLYVITTAKKRDSLDWLKECTAFGVSTNGDDHPEGICVQVDSWNNIAKYVGVKNAFFVFDEQRVVGSGAWVKSFLKIAVENRWILLSATPGDTWLDYIPVFVANGYYKNATEFKREHVVYRPFVRYPQVQRYVGERRLEAYRDGLLVDMPLARLTKRIERFCMVDYDKEKFDTAYIDRWNPYEDEPIKDAGELFRVMRKIVNEDPSRLETIERLFSGSDLGLKAVEKIHKKHPRLIIFYSFDYELEILRGLRESLGVDLAEWNGHKHEELPTSESWIYLVQYVSGAEGWNCVTTDSMIFYSLHYSYKVVEQAKGRIDRMNTTYRDLFYYTLRSNSVIDRMIWRALQNKKVFNEKKALKFEPVLHK